MRAFVLTISGAALVGLTLVEAGSTLLKKEDVPRAIKVLQKGAARDRASAAEALGRRGAVRSSDVKDAVEPLRHALERDKDAKVRAAAAEALGNIGLELDETVPALMTAMKSDRAVPVKLAAIGALGRIGPEAREAMPELRKLAGDKKQKQLSRAARQALKSINAK